MKYFISGSFMQGCKTPKNGISPVTGEVVIMWANTNRRHEDKEGIDDQNLSFDDQNLGFADQNLSFDDQNLGFADPSGGPFLAPGATIGEVGRIKRIFIDNDQVMLELE